MKLELEYRFETRRGVYTLVSRRTPKEMRKVLRRSARIRATSPAGVRELLPVDEVVYMDVAGTRFVGPNKLFGG